MSRNINKLLSQEPVWSWSIIGAPQNTPRNCSGNLCLVIKPVLLQTMRCFLTTASMCFKYFSARMPRRAALRPAGSYQVNQRCWSSPCENEDADSVCLGMGWFIGAQPGDCITTLACYFAFLESQPAVNRAHLQPHRAAQSSGRQQTTCWNLLWWIHWSPLWVYVYKEDKGIL